MPKYLKLLSPAMFYNYIRAIGGEVKISKLSRRQLYARINYICQDAGLDRMDRITLAQELFEDPSIQSYTELSDEDLHDMFYSLKSWKLIQKLRWYNGAMHAENRVFASRIKETALESAERQDRDDSWD